MLRTRRGLEGDPRGARRAELGGVVAGRRRRRLRGARPRIPSLQATWRPRRRGAHGDVAGVRRAGLPRRVRGGERLARPRPPPARRRSSRGRSTAGWRSSRATSRAARATATGRSSSPLEAAAIGRRLGVPDLEMLGLALEGATLVACAHVDDGHAPPRRGDRGGTRGRGGRRRSPGAWACCFLVTACSAVRDYERASEWCDRIAEFAERYGSRYMLAFCRAEYGAVHLWRGSWREAEEVLEASVEDFSRSRPGDGRRSAGGAGRAAAAPGPLRGGAEPAPPGRRVAVVAAVPGAARARPRTDAARGRAGRAGASPAAASIAGWIGRRRWSCWSARASLAASSTRRTPRWSRCARSTGSSAPRRCARRPISPRGSSRPQAASTMRRGRCSRTRSTASSEPAGATTRRARGSSSRRASTRSGARDAAIAEAAAAARPRCASSARCPRPSGRGACSAASHARWRLGARSGHTTRARGAVPARGGADESRDRRAAGRQRAHRAPPRDEHPAQARPPVANRGGGARRAPRPARTTRHVARPGHPDRGEDGRSWRSQRRAARVRWEHMRHLPTPMRLIAQAAALARIDELARANARPDRRTTMTTTEIKAATRAMWAAGDYHRFATRTVWELGPRLVEAAASPPASASSTSPAGPATSRSAPPRRVPASSPRTSPRSTSRPGGRRHANAG